MHPEIFKTISDIVVVHIPEPFPKKTIVANDSWGNRLPYPKLVTRERKSKRGKYKAWEKAVIYQAELSMRQQKWTMFEKGTPLAVGMVFWIPRPKSVKIHERPFPVVVPDLDNYKYAVTNILKGVAYNDDDQIVLELPSAKFYADKDHGADLVIAEIKADTEAVEANITEFYKNLTKGILYGND